jgi:hypothetical protein
VRKLIVVLCLLAALSATAAARVGGWLDEVVFFEEIDQPKVLSMINAGEAQFFANAFMGSFCRRSRRTGCPTSSAMAATTLSCSTRKARCSRTDASTRSMTA